MRTEATDGNAEKIIFETSSMTARITSARLIAFDSFVEVMERKARPEVELEKRFVDAGPKLSRNDRNLAKDILFGGLRWYSKIFWILQNTATRDLKACSAEVRTALVLGTYQIFYLDRVPDRAAVNESVEYIRSKGEMSAVGFVNGILRQISRRAEYFAKPDKKTKPVDYLALQFAHPQWMVERWFERFRFEKMELMLAANNEPPPWFVRVNRLKTPIEKTHDFQSMILKGEHLQSDRGSLRGCVVLKKSPDLGPESLFAQGWYTIQDQASQVISYLVDPQADELIIDACSGPGGKLSHLYELADGKAKIIGYEVNPEQMHRVRQNIERLQFNDIDLREKDFLEHPLTEKPKKILLDAPCSGLGVLRRHPDGKWNKDVSVIHEMAKLQEKMIDHALRVLPVGGELIYSVCSFELEETQYQLERFRDKYRDHVEIVSPVSRLPDYFKRYVTRDNLLMIFSGNQDAMDGFSAFILKKKSDLP